MRVPTLMNAGNLAVQGLGRASCTCRRLREMCDEEELWTGLWEGPLPGGFRNGGKATHAALWLLVKGVPEQVCSSGGCDGRSRSSAENSSSGCSSAGTLVVSAKRLGWDFRCTVRRTPVALCGWQYYVIMYGNRMMRDGFEL